MRDEKMSEENCLFQADPLRLREMFRQNDKKRDTGLKEPADVECIRTIRYGSDPEFHIFDVYRRKGEKKLRPTIISIHGGGWVYGDTEAYRFYCMELARSEFVVVNFNYRLFPEFSYPAAIEDINELLTFLAAHAEDYGIDLSALFFVADSAGAQMASQYLTILTNESYRNLFAFSVPEIKIRAVALNCGIYDMKTVIEQKSDPSYLSVVKEFLEKEPELCLRQADVLSYMDERFPPCLIVTGNGDFLREQSILLQKHLTEKNIPNRFLDFEGKNGTPVGHVFHLDIRSAQAKECNAAELDFFRGNIEAEGNIG